jgi:cell division protein FtsN
MKALIGVLVLSTVFALPFTASFAQDSKTTVIVMPPTPLPANASPQTAEAETMVCRDPRAPIGTRFRGPRICKTQRQWDEEMHREQHNIEKGQNRGCLNSGACPQ